MHEIIRKIHIPRQLQTGVVEEREFFAKLQAEDRLRRKRDRRARMLQALRFGGRLARR